MSLEISTSDIVKIVKEWVKNISDKYKHLLKIETLIDEELVYRVIFQLENCMAQVLVEEPQFAPYKNIAFEIVGMENNKVNNVYSWYNTGNESEDEIFSKLNEGIKFALNYDNRRIN